MISLRSDVRKRMLIVSPIMVIVFAAIMGALMMQGAPTSVVAFAGMGLTVFLPMFIFAYALPHMTVDKRVTTTNASSKIHCSYCGEEIQEDFVVCPVCMTSLTPPHQTPLPGNYPMPGPVNMNHPRDLPTNVEPDDELWGDLRKKGGNLR